MPDAQIAYYAVGVVLIIGSQAAIARGFRGDVRQIVEDLMAPLREKIMQLQREIDTEREERRNGGSK